MVCVAALRPRNAAATREAILAAARERFCRQSYDDVGLRQVANDAGVDAALISRYFGSKEDLFLAVLGSCEAGADLFDGPRESFGRRVADRVVFHRKEGAALQGMQIMLRSIGSARAIELVRVSSNQRFFDPFVAWLGGADGEVRAQLATSLVMGMTVSRELSGFDPCTRTGEAMRDRLAAMLQALVDDVETTQAPVQA
ncbi:MAG: TetR family transcriptional regulator [Caulobacterales bacterium]|nr:TetR family transcriptional regulator [Caulobacterales bacterium]